MKFSKHHPSSDLWFYNQLRLILEDPSQPQEVIKSQDKEQTPKKLVTKVVLPAMTFSKVEMAKQLFKQLSGKLPPQKLDLLDQKYKPAKSFAQLCHSKGKNIAYTAGMGHGKTWYECLHLLDQTYASDDRYALGLSPSRGVNHTIQQKFQWFSDNLMDGEELAEVYQGKKKERRRIRESEKYSSMLLTTPRILLGSYTKYAPIKVPFVKEDVYYSHGSRWARRLASPSFLLIDEIDTFPTSTLMILIPIVRVLKWRNPELQIILSSGTLGNPKRIAAHFFGTDDNYRVIRGSGRRGRLLIRAHLEEKPKQKLKEKLKVLMVHIYKERKKMLRNPQYIPKKVILFINHKLEIDIRKVTREFPYNFSTVHGNMVFESITDRLEEFRTDPEKICLVATQIIQSGVDLPDVTWGIFYGLLEDPQQFMQLRDRICRNPKREGELDIILRASNKFEREMADSANKATLDAFLLRQEPVPLKIPWYTPISLRLWIIFGVLMGIDDILWRINQDLHHLSEDALFQRHLREAFEDLWLNGYIKRGFDNQLVSTSKTKDWIFNNVVHPKNNTTYDIIQIDEGREIKIGRIDYLTLLRHHLPGQSLPLGDYNYIVDSIEYRKQEVHVIKAPSPELYFFKNKVEEKTERTDKLASDPKGTFALLEMKETYTITEVDVRPVYTKKNYIILPLELYHQAVFLSKKVNKERKDIEEVSIPWIKNYLLKELNLSCSELKICEYEDPLLGEGFLIIDHTTVQLAQLIYLHLIYPSITKIHRKKLSVPLEDILELHYSKTKKPFRRFTKFIERYETVIVFIADFHTDGTPLKINGKEVDFRAFWRYFISYFSEASHIIFLGDTIDWRETENSANALNQLNIMKEILEEYNTLVKTTFMLGNHDYSPDFFQWRVPVRTKREVHLSVRTGLSVRICHGDRLGIDKYVTEEEVTKAQIRQFRKERKIRDNCLFVGAHVHKDFCDPKEMTMLVPSMKKYWQQTKKTDRGWFGLLGYDSLWEPETWQIAIDS